MIYSLASGEAISPRKLRSGPVHRNCISFFFYITILIISQIVVQNAFPVTFDHSTQQLLVRFTHLLHAEFGKLDIFTWKMANFKQIAHVCCIKILIDFGGMALGSKLLIFHDSVVSQFSGEIEHKETKPNTENEQKPSESFLNFNISNVGYYW